MGGLGLFIPPRSLAPFSASLALYSDASMQGWGGWCSDGWESFGSWSPSEWVLHMTLLVLRVVFFPFLDCFFAFASDCSFAIRSDNSSVEAFLFSTLKMVPLLASCMTWLGICGGFASSPGHPYFCHRAFLIGCLTCCPLAWELIALLPALTIIFLLFLLGSLTLRLFFLDPME